MVKSKFGKIREGICKFAGFAPEESDVYVYAKAMGILGEKWDQISELENEPFEDPHIAEEVDTLYRDVKGILEGWSMYI